MLRILRHGLTLLCLLATSCALAKSITKTNTHHTAKKDPVNIIINGIKDEKLLKNINSAVKTVKMTHLTEPVNDDSLFSIYEDSPKAIKNAMQPFGYFNPKIDAHYKRNNSNWTMFFHIQKGVRSIVTNVSIKIEGSGNSDKNFLKVLEHYPIKKDEYFLLSNYSDGGNLLFEHAANLGYFKAKMVQNKIIVDLLTNTVKINIIFNTGKRYHFGPTQFSKTPFNIKFLRKFLVYKQGKPYFNYKIQNSQNNLANSSYFTTVIVRPEVKKSVNYQTPIGITLKMHKRKLYTFGLGYSTDTQLRGTAGFKYRWVNSWGHYFDTRLQGSFINYSLVGAYHIPWPNPVKDLFSLKAGAGKLNISRGRSNSKKISIEYKHTYTRWTHTFSFSYLNERYDMQNLPKTKADLFYPEADITYYSTKNHINPENGLRFNVELSGTPDSLSTKSGFVQIKTSAKAVATLLHYEQFVGRAVLAETIIPNINNLPFSLQLLAGGTQSIRGFDYQSIGPGKKMLVTSFEFRQRIWKELFLSGFYDYGNVADSQLFKDASYSAGSGIVFRSPIGVIEIDLAWRLSTPKRKMRLIFGMGPEL